MRDMIFFNPFGATTSPGDAFSSVKPGVVMPHFGRSAVDKLPKPAFLVPAVIEALTKCPDWTSLVQVVPGEADVFCAQDVREHGGIVLTSDSDLLVQDLGLDGRVSFFWGIVYDSSWGTPKLCTPTFSFHSINDQLGIKGIGGLPRVVYEQKINSPLVFEEAITKAKEGSKDTLTSPGYLNFIKEYQTNKCLLDDHAVLDSISLLDPRISEIVVQILIMKEPGLVSDTQTRQTDRGPEVLSMFLPIMTENRDLRSCWTASTNIRATAYGILQVLSSHRSEKIIEYRTLDPSSGRSGRKVDIPGAAESLDACTQLVSTLKRLRECLPSQNGFWYALAVLQDVESSVVDDRTSLSATLLSQATSTVTDVYEYSWDIIHYAAQVQASYYSMRIMKQALDVVLAQRPDSPEPFRELCESLASLPPIQEWPTVEGMSALLSASVSRNILSTVTDILGVPRIDLAQLASESSALKRKKRKQKTDNSRMYGQGAGKKSPSLNPFAILSEASQE